MPSLTVARGWDVPGKWETYLTLFDFVVTANIEIMLSVNSLVLKDFGFLLVYSYTGSCVWLKYLSQCPSPGRTRGSFELFHRWLCIRSCLGSER